ncbi:MAG: hypothetical protein ACR2GC_10140 [Methyloceanibacter sp.]|uniref:hypothetical protein n=1 Tax=Methyloceanibacter sp. TaxID=1965321 RepID=UPI003D9BC319
MAKQEVIKTASSAERTLKPLKAGAVQLNSAGFVSKSWVVIMPADYTVDDACNHPELFKIVKTTNPGELINEGDQVEMRWTDKIVRATVDFAAPDWGISFIGITQIKKGVRDRVMFSDGTYEVRPIDGGYSYFRTRDNVKMTNQHWDTPEAAKAALVREQYPAKVA